MSKPQTRQGLELVRMRNQFYRDNYRRLVGLLMMALAIVACQVGIIFYLFHTRPTPRYFATTTDGRLVKMTPLDVPNVSDASLLTWASQAAVASYTFDFLNYRRSLENIRPLFTRDGFDNYIDALSVSKNLKVIMEKRLVVKAVAVDVPVILKRGLLPDGRYAWRVQMPLNVLFMSSSDATTTRWMLNMIITRVPTLENPKGIGIDSFVLDERDAIPGET